MLLVSSLWFPWWQDQQVSFIHTEQLDSNGHDSGEGKSLDGKEARSKSSIPGFHQLPPWLLAHRPASAALSFRHYRWEGD